jgi:L-idonate 5-dehydrogenase
MPPLRAIFDVHFEASVNERAIRPDLDFLRPARRAVAGGLEGDISVPRSTVVEVRGTFTFTRNSVSPSISSTGERST